MLSFGENGILSPFGYIYITKKTLFLFSDISESNSSFISPIEKLKMYNYMKFKHIA